MNQHLPWILKWLWSAGCNEVSAEDGMTMVIVTHEMGFAKKKDRVLFVDGLIFRRWYTGTCIWLTNKWKRPKSFLDKILY